MAVVFAAGALALGVLAVGLSLGVRMLANAPDPEQIPFEAQQWQAGGEVRWQMKDDLQKNHLREGMSVHEVETLLGESSTGGGLMTYRLRSSTDNAYDNIYAYGLDCLVIELDDDKVGGFFVDGGRGPDCISPVAD